MPIEHNWIVVRDSFGRVIRSRQLPPFAPVDSAVACVRDELRAEGWVPSAHALPDHCALSRGSERCYLDVSSDPPELPDP